MQLGNHLKQKAVRRFVAVLSLAAAVVTLATPLPAFAASATDNEASPPGDRVLDEPAVAVSPRDPRRVITASNDLTTGYIGVYTSSDGGRKFTRRDFLLPVGGRYGSDPGLAFDSKGRAYASFVSFDPGDPGLGGLTVARSDDGGLTWPYDRVAEAVPNRRTATGCRAADFPSIDVDRHRLQNGRPADRIYVAWQEIDFRGADCSEFNVAHHPLKVARSDNGGRTWRQLGSLPYPEGWVPYIPVIHVGPDGTVLVAFAMAGPGARCGLLGGDLRWMVGTSRDGGVHWEIANAHRGACPPRSLGVAGVGVGSMSGALYRLPWNTNVVVNPRSKMRVSVASVGDATGGYVPAVSRSRDGKRWTPGGSVEHLPGEQLEFPRLAAGPDGKLYLLYISELPGSVLIAKMAISRNDGATWGAPITLSSMPGYGSSPNPPQSGAFPLPFIGDYLGNAVGRDGRVHPVWTDARPNPTLATRIYTAHVR